MATVKEIAEWMLKEVATKDLYHDYAAHNIQRLFGSDFVHQKASRNWAISIRKDILNEFRKLSGDAIVWERGSRLWRKRTQSDRWADCSIDAAPGSEAVWRCGGRRARGSRQGPGGRW